MYYQTIKHFAFSLICFSILLSSCKKDEPEEEKGTWVRYGVTYNGSNNLSTVTVTFREGAGSGDKIKLTSGASVLFNDQELSWDGGTKNYKINLGGFIATGTFEYTSSEGEVYTNDVEGKSIGLPNLGVVNRNQNVNVTWIGDPLSSDEEVNLSINIDEIYQYFWQSNVGSVGLVVSSTKLLEFPAGPSTWRMERISMPPIQESADAGGYIELRYEINPQQVYLN